MMSSLSSTPVWADQPFSLVPSPFGSRDLSKGKAHGAHYVAQQMVHLHNCIIRLLNSIYNQAPYVQSPDDIRNFLAYVKHWHGELHHHHQVEDELMFPRIEELTGQVDIMNVNKEQHEAFMPGLEKLGAYATDTTVKDFDGRKLQAIIDEFGAVLTNHLAEEIPTLIALDKYDDAAMRKLWSSTFWYVMRTCDFHVQLPMLSGSFDATWEGGKSGDLEFPPPIYPTISLWLQRKHKPCWKFLPCTFKGQPRPLYALQEQA